MAQQTDGEVGQAARPRPARAGGGELWRVLRWHLLATVLLAAGNGVWLLPVLVRKEFGATDWQTTLVTAAIPVFLMSSVLWGELLRRMALRQYLLLVWLVAILPLGFIGWAQNYWQVLACHIVAAAGFAGWSPFNGQLLKRLYPDSVRGRAFSVVNVVNLLAVIGATFGVGLWLEHDHAAFRVYLPLAALTHLIGMLLIRHAAGLVPSREPQGRGRRSWQALVWPIWHMGAVLKKDRTFLRYEIAFMTYGAAFMACDALVPVLVTDRLQMSWGEYAHATQVVTRFAQLAVILPLGWLHDRIGAIRTCALSFGVLTLYPILLLLARDATWVAVASVAMGFGMAGVTFGWTLGPVALAPRSGKVPQYAAIHATLVGVRGICFQGLAMGIYKLSNGFTLPFVAAALAFAAAALQMWLLHRTVRPRLKQVPVAAAPSAAPTPAPHRASE